MVEVILPLPLEGPFTYAVPPEMAADALPGCRVLVPFGNRQLTGVVTRPVVAPPEGVDVRPLLEVLDDEPSLTPELLALTEWIAGYYACSWGEAARAALPAGLEVESRQRVVLTHTGDPTPWLGQRVAARTLRYLNEHESAVLRTLRQRVPGLTLRLIRRLERDGLVRLEAEVKERRVRPRTERAVRLAPAAAPADARAALRGTLRGTRQSAFMDALWVRHDAGDTEPALPDVLAQSGAASATARTLAERGFIEVFAREVMRTPTAMTAHTPEAEPGHELNAHQAQALGAIGGAISTGAYRTFLLHGITGSGKTEVYIAALKATLERGRRGIILVPEIALTPQTVRRFRTHFGNRIAVLHSRMSPGERFDTWRGIRAGRFDVVIGPRSAIFAPLENVGLIVVDEEHEPSYKQYDPAPRYHARDVAVVRAMRAGAVCVLGSATPCLETWANAQSGKYTLLDMPERVPVRNGSPACLPNVHVVDLTVEQRVQRLHGALSNRLREAIRLRLERQEQTILLQNRRGYSPIIECGDCGWSPMCPDCSVTLTYHKARHHLRCHYCGLTRPVPAACPKCGGTDLEQIGAGTQRVEEELAELFPTARLIRMDLDTTGRKDAHHHLLDRFGRGDADILVGTQMVAKGLDFERVTLVGVVNADAGMLLPDFRAEERTFQLLTQVAGRAGRADRPGEVFLQTRRPAHPVLRFACSHDYKAFVAHALPERKACGYPPYGRVVGVEFRGPDEGAVATLAGAWTDALAPLLPPDVDVLGPAAAFIGRVKRLYRYHTILKVARNVPHEAVRQALRAASRTHPPEGYRVAIDVDAMGLF